MSQLDFHTYSWDVDHPKAILHIVHGMSEHAARYEGFAKALNEAGYGVVASDLRGHGKTANGVENIGYFAKRNGWKLVTQDVIDLTKKIRNQHAEIPVFILGHSMGSFITRNVAFVEPNLADGYIYSGTMGNPGWKGAVGKPLAKMLASLFGRKKKSKFLMNTSFLGWDKHIEDKKTHRDWLSRDMEAVEAYINDPYCAQTFTNQFFYDLAVGVNEIYKTKNINKVNKNTPVLFVSGSMDPAGAYGKGPKEVYAKYRAVGVKDVELQLFKGGRHEILNEINKEEVYAHLIDWLDRHCKK